MELLTEDFEDTKGVITIGKSKKNRKQLRVRKTRRK
jgi:hypothetical protein